MTTTRTDCHRPGAIVPAHYKQVLCYSLPTTEGGWPVHAIGVNCELDHRHEVDGHIVNGTHQPDGLCCVVAMHGSGKVFAETGGTGQCSVCGTHFVYGEVWRHTPTGVLIHIGHECAAKYQLLADRSAWELENRRVRNAAAVACQRAQNAEERAAFLAAHPELVDAFALVDKHPILADLHDKFTRYLSLSDRQIALAVKLADEIRHPQPEEVHVAAPVSDARVTIRGVLVSKKTHEGAYGTTIKGTIKVHTDAGVWLAWGTLPDSLLCGYNGAPRAEVGDTVELQAKLMPGRESHFVFWKRPTQARIIERAARPKTAGTPAA